MKIYKINYVRNKRAFSTFEKVLTTFTDKNGNPLINYFNPGP